MSEAVDVFWLIVQDISDCIEWIEELALLMFRAIRF